MVEAADTYEKVTCPICHTEQNLLYDQWSDGTPTGKRFIAHHTIVVKMNVWTRKPALTIACPLSGKMVDA